MIKSKKINIHEWREYDTNKSCYVDMFSEYWQSYGGKYDNAGDECLGADVDVILTGNIKELVGILEERHDAPPGFRYTVNESVGERSCIFISRHPIANPHTSVGEILAEAQNSGKVYMSHLKKDEVLGQYGGGGNHVFPIDNDCLYRPKNHVGGMASIECDPKTFKTISTRMKNKEERLKKALKVEDERLEIIREKKERERERAMESEARKEELSNVARFILGIIREKVTIAGFVLPDVGLSYLGSSELNLCIEINRLLDDFDNLKVPLINYLTKREKTPRDLIKYRNKAIKSLLQIDKTTCKYNSVIKHRRSLPSSENFFPEEESLSKERKKRIRRVSRLYKKTHERLMAIRSKIIRYNKRNTK